MSPALGIAIALLLLAANALFVAGEFCVTSSRKAQIDPLAEAGVRGARAAQWALEHVSVMLAFTQLGITLASTGLGAVAEPAVAHLVSAPLAALAVPAAMIHPIAFVFSLILVVFLHILVGEMIPKNLTVSAPVPVVLALAPVLVRLARVMHPVIAALNGIANFFVRLSGGEPQDEVAATFTAEEVASIVERSRRAGMLDDDLGLLSGTLEFSEETVGAVMVALDDLVTVGEDVTPARLEQLVAKTGYSRFPVTDQRGLPRGYLHLKDVLYACDQPQREAEVPAWRVRPLPRIAAGAEVEDALALMQRTGTHLAAVDGSGHTVGVIFLEDILEELVGEVRDVMQRSEQ